MSQKVLKLSGLSVRLGDPSPSGVGPWERTVEGWVAKKHTSTGTTPGTWL